MIVAAPSQSRCGFRLLAEVYKRACDLVFSRHVSLSFVVRCPRQLWKEHDVSSQPLLQSATGAWSTAGDGSRVYKKVK